MSALYSLYYENWRLTLLTVLLLLVSGLAAMNTLPKQEDPSIGQRFGTVSVFMPGATAERMEALIVEPLELSLREINDIRHLNSTALPGAAIIGVELHEWVARSETDAVWSQVSDQLRRARPDLPAQSSEPQLEVLTVQADALMVALRWRGQGRPQMRLLQRLAEDLRLRFGSVGGTRATELFGASEEQLLIEVDPAELVAAGLTVQDLAQAVRSKDGRRPAGQLQSGVSRIALDLHENLSTPERIRNLQVPLPGGQSARLGDLAEVRKSLGAPPQSQVLVDGEQAVVVSAQSEPSTRVDAWTARLLAVLDEFRRELPQDIGLEVVYDQSTYTSERLDGLMFNLMLAASIVLLVLIFFQGVRPAIVISVALPLTCLGALALMGPMGVGLQQMSVTGLIISLGLLIDNPIVVVDHYQRLRREGRSPVQAIRAAVGHLKTPLLASTLTTIFAFMPIVAGEGATPEFIGSMALVVILAVALSLFLALTVIPTLNAFWEAHWPGRDDFFSRGFVSARLAALYAASIDLVVRRPALGVAVGLALPLAGFLAFATLERNFFPPVDRDMFRVSLSVWSAGALRETRAQVERVREEIARTPGIGRDVWFIGGEAARPFYNVQGVDDGGKGEASGFVYTDSAARTREILPELQYRLRQKFPGMRVRVAPFDQGPPVNAALEVRLVGEDLDLIRGKSDELRAMMLGLKQVTYARSSLTVPSPHLVLYPRQEELLAAGISEADLATFMAAALDGLRAGNMMDSGRQLPIVIGFPEQLRGDWQRLQGVSLLRAADGSLVPLEAVAEYRLEPGLQNIKHRDGERLDEVQAWLMPFALASNSQAELRRRLGEAGFQLPPGVKMETGGEAEESGEAIGKLLQTAAFFGILMLFSVVLSFSSFLDAAIVTLTAALSIGLAMFGLRLADQIFGFTAIVGTLGLIGLSINGTIIVLSALKSSSAAMAGDLLAIRQAIMNSTRHILATTVTTVLGLSPLLLSNQTFWHPLVWTIAGGVSGSALIALYLMPALFSLRTRRARRQHQPVASPAPAPADAVPDPIPQPAP